MGACYNHPCDYNFKDFTLKIETKFEDNHQAKLIVEVENASLEKSKRKAAKSLAKRVKIPGFRPGKAPYNVIQNHVGDAAILESAVDILIDEIYPKAIEEAKLNPYGPGSLENVSSMEPPTFEFIVPLSPEVNLGNYRDIRIDYKEKQVEEKDIDEVIENLRAQQAVIEPTDREIQESDLAYIMLSGEKISSEEGEDKSLINEQKFPVVIEKEDVDKSSEWPFPGFSRKLIGMKVGDEAKFDYKFKKDYEYEELQGVKAEYSVQVEEIKSRILPDLNDEFAKSVGDYENLENMQEEIKKSLSSRYDQETNSEYESKIIDKIVEDAEIKFPSQMIDHEIDHMIEDLENRLTSQGLNMEVYLKSREQNLESLREEFNPAAEERIKRSLVFMEITSQEKIELSSEEIEAKTKETIEEIKMYFPEEEVKKLTSGEALQSLVNKIITDEITVRTLERLRKIAKGEKIEEEIDEDQNINSDRDINSDLSEDTQVDKTEETD